MSDNPLEMYPTEKPECFRAWNDYYALGQKRSFDRLIEHYRRIYVECYQALLNISTEEAEAALQADSQAVRKIIMASDYRDRLPPTIRLASLKTWSATFNWQERLRLKEIGLEAERQARMVERQKTIIEASLEDYDKQLLEWRGLMEQAKSHKRTIRRTLTHEERGPDGQPIQVKELATIVALNVGDYLNLARLRKEIDDLGRRAVGLPSNISDNKALEETKTGRQPIQLIFPKGFSDEAE